MVTKPQWMLIGGPNGSGKSTLTQEFVREGFSVLDTDHIAKLLSPKNPSSHAFAAGRMTLNNVKDNINRSISFSVESTLSSKHYLKLIEQAKLVGFQISLVYIGVNDPLINIARVSSRVKKGGHHVPQEDIVRRYYRSLLLLPDYLAKADEIRVFDNSGKKAKLLFERNEGVACFVNNNCPSWFQNVLEKLN